MTAMHIIRCECCWFRLTILSYTLSVYRVQLLLRTVSIKRKRVHDKKRNRQHTQHSSGSRARYIDGIAVRIKCTLYAMCRRSAALAHVVVVSQSQSSVLRESSLYSLLRYCCRLLVICMERKTTLTQRHAKKSILTDKYA